MNGLASSSLRILSTLAWHPDRWFHQREVAKEAGVSLGSANRLLKGLVEGKLVKYERRGSLHTYKFNIENPIARQFKVLLNVCELEQLTGRLAESATRVILYGSCARGTDGDNSDIDLLVQTEDKNEAEKIVNETTTRHRISPIILNSPEYNHLKNTDKPLHDEIERGVILWEKE